MKIGIIGLPLSGKSTVFNALTGLNAEVRKYSASGKIKPNIGVVEVYDERLDRLAQIYKPDKITYSAIDFVDMVGISKEAKAEDLDLAPIKETDALVCVVRLFEDESVSHPYGSIDAGRDLEMLHTELILLDLDITQKRIEKIEQEVKKGKKENEKELNILNKCKEALSKELPLSRVSFDIEEEKLLAGFQFLTKKPLLVLANIDENQLKQHISIEGLNNIAEHLGIKAFVFCAKIEAEIAQLDDDELKNSFLKDLGLERSEKEEFVRACFSLLDLVTFFTVKGKEAKSWVIKRETSAFDAAGKIHTDIQRGFIKAEVFNYKDLEECSFDVDKVKAQGKLMLEGKEYIVKDGDVIFFRFNI